MNTYAIVQTGSKQYRVEAGDSIRVESLPVYTGEIVDIDDVLMVSREGDVTVGAPVVEGARVRAQVTSRGRGRKITVFKYKPKVRYRRTKGHRQRYTDLRIIDISMDGESLAAVKEQVEPLDEVEETADVVESDVAEDAEAVADEPANETEDEATVAEDDPVDGDEPTDNAPDEPEGDAGDGEPVAEDDQTDTDQTDGDRQAEPADEPESVAEPVDTDEVKKEKQDGA